MAEQQNLKWPSKSIVDTAIDSLKVSPTFENPGLLPVNEKNGLSTGSTILNVHLTDDPRYGLAKGTFHHFVGASGSGKTFLTLTCFAEASISKTFNDYRLIFDNAENGALMDFDRFFGTKAAHRIEEVNSDRVEEFYDRCYKLMDRGDRFVMVVDSHDALSSSEEMALMSKHRKARAEGKTESGSYGDGKAKKNSVNLRGLVRDIRKSGSIVIMISQERDNIGFDAMFNPNTVSGGRALKFYSHTQIWMRNKGKIKKTVRGKARTLGQNTGVKITKNRFTGIESDTCLIPILWSMGIDDAGGIFDYLLAEKVFSGSGKSFRLSDKQRDIQFSGSRDKAIKLIENHPEEFRDLVGETYRAVKRDCVVDRVRRYV